MNIADLAPEPNHFEIFRRNRERYVPERSGCYALTTFSEVVLYIGLTKNLRKRMSSHLDSAKKTGPTACGKAVFIFWTETDEVNRIERTWMNIHIQQEGALPVLNRLYSPTST